MSDKNQRNGRDSGATLFDPEAFSCWRSVAAAANLLRTVHILTARSAPMSTRLAGHIHAEPTMVCCLTGVVRIETAGKPLDLLAGEAAVVAPGAWHRHAPLRGNASVFAQGVIGRRSDVLLATAQRSWWLTLNEEPSHGHLKRALSAETSEQRRAAIRDIIAGFAQEPAAALQMSAEQVAMARYMWANFWRPIEARDILRASSLKRAQAHALFTACYGDTPKRALTRCRMRLAAHLEAEGMLADEIALRSGFVTSAQLRRTTRRLARTRHAR
jgi:AraC-like DNA-binding protein